MVCPASCPRLAGESPVAVSKPVRRVAGSRREERSDRPSGASKALVSSYELGGGEQSYGPNDREPLQPREIEAERQGGRAGHVTAKAMDWTSITGWVQDSLGVWEAARSESLGWNRRGPTRPPPSGKDPTYKPSAKWSGAERESEGFIVLLTPGENRDEGRGPTLVALAREGKCEGMVG
jgi:hypothetical protein